MTADLSTFAKVRALHDSATSPGEKAAAAGRMKALATKVGMTVTEAVSKLDAPMAPPAAPRSIFEDLFNTPEFRAQRAERQREHADRRAAALAEYGSEDAVWEPGDREQALEAACHPVIVCKPIINGEMDTLQGWDGGRWAQLPPAAQAAVSSAYAPPASVCEAWAEFRYWEKIADDRVAFSEHHDHDVRVRGRLSFIEHLLDTMPARSMGDLRARLDWMQHLHDRGWNRGDPEDGELLAALRADTERMGARLREQDAADVQNGQGKDGVANLHPTDGQGPAPGADPLTSPDPGTSNSGVQIEQEQGGRDPIPPSPAGPEFYEEVVKPTSGSAAVQSGRAEGYSDCEYPSRRTNADKRRDVLALLNVGVAHNSPLTNREIARRAGVSPTTVGAIRRRLA
ncbi:Lrp/AsnC family transcriptional regulator [Methylobacterium sp. J-043]|nr:Lrp/AsnC family transcriptional regulator [Methylobacterium sp. J-043]